MAKMRVFTAEEWDFFDRHPDIVWEGTEPVYYRTEPTVSGFLDLTRYDVFLAFASK